jgi:hypothetical protein
MRKTLGNFEEAATSKATTKWKGWGREKGKPKTNGSTNST